MIKHTHINPYYFLFVVVLLASCSPKGYEKYSYLVKDKSALIPEKPLEEVDKVEEDQTNQTFHEDEVVKEAKEVSENLEVYSYTDKLLQTANSYMGVPYKYGGMSRKGMDCSGLMCLVYGSIGENIPHSSRLQSQLGRNVSFKKLKPGNMVFFKTRGSASINHVGMITKANREGVYFIHATTSRGVRVDRLDEGYWKKIYVKGVEIENKKADLRAR